MSNPKDTPQVTPLPAFSWGFTVVDGKPIPGLVPEPSHGPQKAPSTEDGSEDGSDSEDAPQPVSGAPDPWGDNEPDPDKRPRKPIAPPDTGDPKTRTKEEHAKRQAELAQEVLKCPQSGATPAPVQKLDSERQEYQPRERERSSEDDDEVSAETRACNDDGYAGPDFEPESETSADTQEYYDATPPEPPIVECDDVDLDDLLEEEPKKRAEIKPAPQVRAAGSKALFPLLLPKDDHSSDPLWDFLNGPTAPYNITIARYRERLDLPLPTFDYGEGDTLDLGRIFSVERLKILGACKALTEKSSARKIYEVQVQIRQHEAELAGWLPRWYRARRNDPRWDDRCDDQKTPWANDWCRAFWASIPRLDTYMQTEIWGTEEVQRFVRLRDALAKSPEAQERHRKRYEKQYADPDKRAQKVQAERDRRAQMTPEQKAQETARKAASRQAKKAAELSASSSEPVSAETSSPSSPETERAKILENL